MSRRYKTLRAATEGSEADFQKWVIDLAELHGWRVVHTPDSRTINKSMVGFPDLLMFSPNSKVILLRELKLSGGRLSAEQKQWGDYLRKGGWDYSVWRPEHKGLIQLILEREGRDVL